MSDLSADVSPTELSPKASEEMDKTQLISKESVSDYSSAAVNSPCPFIASETKTTPQLKAPPRTPANSAESIQPSEDMVGMAQVLYDYEEERGWELVEEKNATAGRSCVRSDDKGYGAVRKVSSAYVIPSLEKELGRK